MTIWDFQTLWWELSAPADCSRREMRLDSRVSGARDAAPCTEQSDATALPFGWQGCRLAERHTWPSDHV